MKGACQGKKHLSLHGQRLLKSCAIPPANIFFTFLSRPFEARAAGGLPRLGLDGDV